MIILRDYITPQTFSFISREKNYQSMTIKDESTGVETSVTIDEAILGEYVDTITASFTLKQNRYYMLKITDGAKVVFLDKVFCTNQALQTYSINHDTYTSNASNNEYIVYE